MSGDRTLPAVLPGHWETAEGLQMAEKYARKSRANLAMGDRPDLVLANALYLADGELMLQTAAKERMRWLSVQLALANARIAELELEQTISSAPKDGTMVWLLVDYSDEAAGDHPLVDAQRAWTIGFNNLANDGEDAWKFAGWCWSHDHFNEGRGRPIAWKPIGFELEVAA